MAAAAPPKNSVQCFVRKKTAVAVAHCKKGKGLIKINGVLIELLQPEILRAKACEPIYLLGQKEFQHVDMRIRVKGGGYTSQIYAIRQSIAKALVAYAQNFEDEERKKYLNDDLVERLSEWFKLMATKGTRENDYSPDKEYVEYLRSRRKPSKIRKEVFEPP